MIVRSDTGAGIPLADGSVQCVVTSPPYWGLRDYGVEGQIGLEATVDEYVARLVEVFRDVRRVLRDDGMLWLNLGDAYAGSWGSQSRDHAGKHAANVSALSANQVKAAQIRKSGTGLLSRAPGLKAKDLIGIPWRVAFALQSDGWWLRSDIIWKKPNPMPESVRDRPTRSHEYLFLLTKSGSPKLWVHRDRPYSDYVTEKPSPDWRWVDAITGDELAEAPPDDDTSSYKRINLWSGYDYYYDADAIREEATDIGRENGRNGRIEHPDARPPGSRPRTLKRLDYSERGRNKRDVWTVATEPCPDAHFATFPAKLITPCILAGCPAGGIVFDPFVGTGTIVRVAYEIGRRGVGCELSPEYIGIARRKCAAQMGLGI